jgi:hypothetical protein
MKTQTFLIPEKTAASTISTTWQKKESRNQKAKVSNVYGLTSYSTIGVAGIYAPIIDRISTHFVNLRKLEKVYEIKNEYSVDDYLSENRELETILLTAHLEIQQYFSDTIEKLELELVQDAEITSIHTLCVNIYINASAEEAFDMLCAFDDGWLLDHISDFAGKLNFDVAFL